jgi:hypothetical protein
MKEMLTKIAGKLSSFKAFWDKLSHNINHLWSQQGTFKKPVESEWTKEYALLTLVEKARREWEEAQMLFNEVKEPELIDHAIYNMEATERKYMFLLKEAKKGNVVHEEVNCFLKNNPA